MSSHADVDRLRHCRKAGSRKSRNVKTRVRLRKAAACGLGEVEAAGGAAANVPAGRKAVHDRQVDILEAALNFNGFTKGARHRRRAFAESDDRRLQQITLRAGNDARGRLRFHINALGAALEGDPPKIRRKQRSEWRSLRKERVLWGNTRGSPCR